MKVSCASSSTSGTRVLERCCHFPEGSIQSMQQGSREREALYSQFTIQRPAHLIYIAHLPAHAVLTLDIGSPAVLSGWDAAATSNQQINIQALDEYTVDVRHG